MEENNSVGKAVQNRTEYEFTEAEQKLLDVLLNPDYRMKSVKEICSIAAIGRTTYYAAFKKPEFQALYKAQSKALVDQSIAPVLNTFVREALRGSFQHGKVILEMAGLYSEKSTLEITGEVTLTAEDRRARLAEIQQQLKALGAIDVPYQVISETSQKTTDIDGTENDDK